MYQKLTNDTINAINNILPGGKILDLGAGTGRITIPLLQNEYEVLPVEISKGMYDVLVSKLTSNNLKCDSQNKSIATFNFDTKADLAVCVFTVLIYITTKEEMVQTIKNIAKHLKSNGLFFFDISSITASHSGVFKNNYFTRKIVISHVADSLYNYNEECFGVFNNEPFRYCDVFPLRQWTEGELNEILSDCGFENTNKSFPEFNGTGATYKLFRKL